MGWGVVPLNPSRHPLSLHLLLRSRLAKPCRISTILPPPHRRAAGVDLTYLASPLAGSRWRQRRRAVHVHMSEVLLVAVLDRIGSRIAEGNDYADHVHMNASALDLQGCVDALSHSLLASPRSV